MAIRYNPTLVTSGIVLALDAANIKSYPGSGTTWLDLSGSGNTGTFTNGPTFSSSNQGSIVFDGTDDIVTTSLSATLSFTWSVWFKTNVLASGYRNIISVPTGAYMLMLLDISTNNMGFWSSDGMNGGSLGVDSLSTNTWYNAVLVREGDGISGGYKAYLNSVFKGSANTSTWTIANTISLGGRTDASQYLNGNIAQVAIYNTALNQDQINQNFYAYRGRFGV